MIEIIIDTLENHPAIKKTIQTLKTKGRLKL